MMSTHEMPEAISEYQRARTAALSKRLRTHAEALADFLRAIAISEVEYESAIMAARAALARSEGKP